MTPFLKQLVFVTAGIMVTLYAIAICLLVFVGAPEMLIALVFVTIMICVGGGLLAMAQELFPSDDRSDL